MRPEPRGLASGSVTDPVLNRLVEELADKLQDGETVDLDAYRRRYPDQAEKIEHLFSTIAAMAGLAWNLKAWSALMVPVSPRHAAKHEAEKRKWLRMEFATFCAAVIQMPCQIVKTGKRLIYRLQSRTPWQGMFLRLVERLHGCWLY
jgi:hypothetical protein